MMKRLQALLLILATAQAQAEHTPTNSRPEDLSTRSLERQDEFDAIHRLSQHAPAAVRKMNPGEKFYPHYWQSEVEESWTESGNASILATNLLPPLQLHSSGVSDDNGRHWPRNLFSKRGYQCPSDTNSCTSINRPNSCCGTGEQCQLVTDTGSGDVGCCPSGATCGGSISTCNTAAGYTACPDSSNGGCCIPGYACNSIGCIAMGSTTITASGSTVVVMASSSISTSTSTTYQVAPSVATTTTLTSTTTFTPSSTPGTTVYTTTTTPTSTVTISPSISTATALTVTTITASPAVLATLNSESSTNSQIVTSTIPSTASSQTSQGAAYCPTGFYQCSAYYQGCCQIGYGCGTSSCLVTSSSTTIVSGDDVTIVVATGSGVTTITDSSPNPNSASPTSSGATAIVGGGRSGSGTTTTTTAALLPGMCATGWYSCAAGDGGGCCPSGYSCAASCIATQTGEPGKVYKVPPSSPANQISLDYLMTHILSAVIIAAALALL